MTSNSDWNKVLNLLLEFRYFLNTPNKLKVEGPISLNDLWKDGQYPCAEYVGCYFIFDQAGTLLYIGKASASSSIGRRLSTYFKNDPQDSKKWVKEKSHVWSKAPFYIAAIGVEKMGMGNDSFGWLAPSLEEFLIGRFGDLPDNTQLKNKI